MKKQFRSKRQNGFHFLLGLVATTSKGAEVSIVRPMDGNFFIFLLGFTDFRDKFFKIWARFAKIYLLG